MATPLKRKLFPSPLRGKQGDFCIATLKDKKHKLFIVSKTAGFRTDLKNRRDGNNTVKNDSGMFEPCPEPQILW
ncbi:MAG: hypothetical protein FWD39_02220 [Clostridiales bacterium]|nr:hypothetical protein [Clostridiales bacterium]